jgi:hypothetical protein
MTRPALAAAGLLYPVDSRTAARSSADRNAQQDANSEDDQILGHALNAFGDLRLSAVWVVLRSSPT